MWRFRRICNIFRCWKQVKSSMLHVIYLYVEITRSYIPRHASYAQIVWIPLKLSHRVFFFFFCDGLFQSLDFHWICCPASVEVDKISQNLNSREISNTGWNMILYKTFRNSEIFRCFGAKFSASKTVRIGQSTPILVNRALVKRPWQCVSYICERGQDGSAGLLCLLFAFLHIVRLLTSRLYALSIRY